MALSSYASSDAGNTPSSIVSKVFTVAKRNGEVVNYDIKKIVNAVAKCFSNTNEGGEVDAMKIALKVDKELNFLISKSEESSVSVELIQDLVEKYLMLEDYFLTIQILLFG